MIIAILCLLLMTGGAQALTAAPAEGDLYAEAESRYLGKNYAAALESYDAFLAGYSQSERVPDVQYRRATCYYRLGRYRDAVQLIADIEKRYRSTRYFSYVPLWKGLSLYELGSFSLSIASLEEFLGGAKDAELTPQALLYRSRAQIALGNDGEALSSLAILTGEYQASRVFPYASVLRGSVLQKRQSWADLLDFTQKVDPAGFPDPWKGQFLLLKAEALWQSGRAADAQPIFLQLVGAPDEVALAAYRRLFSAAQRRNDLQGMRDLSQAAESRFGGHAELLAELWTRVGAESFRRGAPDTAEPFLRRAWNARAQTPPNEIVPLYLAEIMRSRKDEAGARQILTDYLAVGRPGTGAAIIRLGDFALMADDFPGAAAYYTRFRAAFPDSKRTAEAGYLLAYCSYRQGKSDDASRLVDSLLAADQEPSLRQQIERLHIALLNKAARTADAALALKEYIARYPADLRSRLDYMKALFALKQEKEIISAADAARRQFPDMGTRDPSAAIVVSYLRGLALVGTKDYRGAIAELGTIQEDAAKKAGLAIVVPYTRYYLGWGLLKETEFVKAGQVFDDLAAAYPTHELSPMVAYLAGWSHFSAAEYEKAAIYFSQISAGGGAGDLAQKSRYLYAKSLLNMKKTNEAAPALLRIATAVPASPWAADALFDYAGVLSDTGQARPAADAYRRLADSFPDSPLREEAVYRIGETWFSHQGWGQARAAYEDYRVRYPRGRLVDAALYWGGQAARAAGEGIAGALLWEQLISGYHDSAFRGSAMQQTAEVYAQGRQFGKSLDLYARFTVEYPDEARAARADIRIAQIRALAAGESDREAELTGIIARESGDRKRRATLDLARLYIYGGDKQAEAGYRLLLPIIKEGNPAAAPEAQVLVGEYFYRKADMMEAARQFLAAALVPKVDAKVAAAAIYRAAEMMHLANRPEEVAALVKRLQAAFPDSEWTVKARLLLGGAS
jgi:TolA-binding protein